MNIIFKILLKFDILKQFSKNNNTINYRIKLTIHLFLIIKISNLITKTTY